MQKIFEIGTVPVGFGQPLFIIAGPCVIESESLCLHVADFLVNLQRSSGVKCIFKASFDKANRTSIDSFRGPGMEKGLSILERIRNQTGLPVLTDVHEPSQAKPVGEVVDCLQIPAFLCRQTDLLVACGQTGKPVNIKKGQFVSPEEMKNCVEKVRSTGNNKIMLTERGTFFGYNRLVNDMTSIPAMQQFGCPVVFDTTHSTQRPGGLGIATAGKPDMAPVLARAAVAAGANALFMEVHPNPAEALCDAACMLPLDNVQSLVESCRKIYEVVNNK
ncbi:MAG TPA: 3-deoxy-8-phosphooctulonate synthase [Anaerohalosphaeraceae bacterium]|nr:3-deoxy-8-phosphooctulonate synthase [Phycisphaerae bacterium]HOK95605.1 3-deoxy-8-phosphooctulonate synthase [Anaerohalosphaeraceae bacterium]HOL32796.1 3-deoxy-8-phosphooctulonate synthase [Anaerohalosphaeraceae bacterium]HOM74892.1 3-deoxy-8-phosphooctulonate synthase [Anaerohalosphaeraceae bacterium]HPC63855.1 3-deoxy-8-phosphooctulonate synthase [Anaerohalosphaeraceae bacterium]